MKKIFIIPVFIILLSSCQSYLMSTISSHNLHKDDMTGIQSLENDSLIISYNFSGENSPLQIEVYNKLNEPLFVNWEHSALIIADKAYSFVNNDLKLEATSSTIPDIINTPNNDYTSSTISGTIKVSTKEGFVPPKSKISRKIYILNSIPLPKVDKSAFKPATFNFSDGTGSVYAKEAVFTEQNSPLKFKSYLTFFTLQNNIPHTFNYQQDFFVSTVTKSATNPKRLIEFSSGQANVIVKTKTTGYGKVMTGVAVVGALGIVGATDAALDKNNRNK